MEINVLQLVLIFDIIKIQIKEISQMQKGIGYREKLKMAYTRKTHDEWEIQGIKGYGWECEAVELTWKDAKEQCRCYRENVSYPIRIVKRRVKN